MEGTVVAMKGEDEDRISNLPKELRNHIVSFLSMKDAVRICSLSKEWRNICSSLPNLSFDYNDFPNTRYKLQRFVDFVDRMLLLHDESDIHKLKLFGVQHVDITRINSWIALSVNHNVQILYIDGLTRDNDIHSLPSYFFTQELPLGDSFVKFPTDIQLTKLKTLVLGHVEFSDDNLTGKIFSSCPVLEKLTIEWCNMVHLKILDISPPKLKDLRLLWHYTLDCKIKVSSPTLQRIQVFGGIGHDFVFENLSSLQAALLLFDSSMFHSNDRPYPIIEVLKSFYNVEVLALSDCFIEGFSRVGNLSTRLPTSFKNLKRLYIPLLPTEYYLSVIEFLIRTCPNLEVLNMQFTTKGASPNMLNQERESLNFSVEGMIDHLKTVRMFDFRESETEVKLVKIFLENAKELKEMRISFHKDIDQKKRIEISEKLNTFRRSSSSAIVFVI